jgi:hypothetical protein
MEGIAMRSLPSFKKQTGTLWCGPYAIATVMGISYEDADALVREVRRRNGWKGEGRKTVGMYQHGMSAALDAVWVDQYRPPHTRKGRRPTFAAWQRSRKPGLYVLNVTGHFIVCDGPWVIDQSGKRHHTEYEHRRQQVRMVWQVKETQ